MKPGLLQLRGWQTNWGRELTDSLRCLFPSGGTIVLQDALWSEKEEWGGFLAKGVWEKLHSVLPST